MATCETLSILFSGLVTVLIAFTLAKLLFRKRTGRVSTQSSTNTLNPVEKTSLVKQSASESGRAAATAASEDKGKGKQTAEYEEDWQDVEATEMEDDFAAAVAYVASMAAQSQEQIPKELLLQLYALYKVATEGPCTDPQPSALKITARAKWNAWQSLGTMPAEEAMQKYIEIVTMTRPNWDARMNEIGKMQERSGVTSTKTGGMGPVFSSFVEQEEELDGEVMLDAIHMHAREGHITDILDDIRKGVPVDLKDSQDRTPLHWAVDRGHISVVNALVSHGADLNAKDMDGQTPLHYAAVCEREEIAKYLVSVGADALCKDNDGLSPESLFPSSWHSISDAAPRNIV